LDPNERYNWEKDLTPSPLQRKGFDEQLKQRIEEQLDRKEAQRRRWLWPVAGACTVCAVAAAVWIVAPFDRDNGLDALVKAAAPHTVEYRPAEPPLVADTAAEEPAPVKTGVLIGLRQDSSTAGSPGEYRTMMLAPVDGQVTVAAEGEGILVPYGQKFWKIDMLTHTTDTDVIHYLSAYPADKEAAAASFLDDPDEQVRHTETLLFAGNQYVSVAEEEASGNGQLMTTSSQVWVRKLNQMAAAPVPSSADKTSYVTIQDIFGEGARQVLDRMLELPSVPAETGQAATGERVAKVRLSGDNWAITRKPGHWTAQVAEVSSSSGEQPDRNGLQEYPVALPEVVTSHDSVFSTWGQVKSLQAEATDLLASPLEDLIVVLTSKEMLLYPSNPTSGGKPDPLLHVQLKPGEQLVSAQWATGSYVAEWVEKSRKYLQGMGN
jgi:hypothetical protein